VRWRNEKNLSPIVRPALADITAALANIDS
jgi:hypothetical protein